MSIQPLKPLFSIVEDHSEDGLRAGEGSIVELQDGRLLMFYSSFPTGGGDADAAIIASRTSTDGGLNWSSLKQQFIPPDGALNAMSASLLRLQDGQIACVFLIKWAINHLTPMWACSQDEGDSWSTPVPISQEIECFCVNNDRLVQLADATLVLPYARLQDTGETPLPEFDYRWNMLCGLFFSEDGGQTWQRSPHEITHTPEVFAPPIFKSAVQLQGDLAYQLENRLGVFQEPGVQQLSDGSLLLYMRSSYCIHKAYAKTVTSPWENCGIFEGMNVCCGPQTIRRLPKSGNLILFYNDRGSLPWGEEGFGNRTPLSVGISRDEGQTWERWGQLEDDSRNYCYFSLLFFGERFISSYYQSATNQGKKRRNLASLKICVGLSDLFETPQSTTLR